MLEGFEEAGAGIGTDYWFHTLSYFSENERPRNPDVASECLVQSLKPP